MDELQALRHELADLRREVGSLRRTRWITPGAVAAVLIALVALGLASPLRQDPPARVDHTPNQLAQEINCKVLRIVDATGKTMLQLQADKDGGSLVINGADGKAKYYTGIEKNAGFTDWFDANGMRRATLFAQEGGGQLQLLDKLGKNTVAVLHENALGGTLQLKAPDGKDRFVAGVDNGGGFADIYDSLETRRETFYLSDKNVAQFKLVGPDKVGRLLLSANPEGGQAVSYDADGKPVAQFPEKPKK